MQNEQTNSPAPMPPTANGATQPSEVDRQIAEAKAKGVPIYTMPLFRKWGSFPLAEIDLVIAEERAKRRIERAKRKAAAAK